MTKPVDRKITIEQIRAWKRMDTLLRENLGEYVDVLFNEIVHLEDQNFVLKNQNEELVERVDSLADELTKLRTSMFRL